MKQLDIFDFIEKPQEPEEDNRTSLERIFGKVADPAAQCANCLCERCVNNVEDVWSKVRPEEQKEPCFNCDECWHYTGNRNHKSQRIEDCRKFEISTSSRKKFKVIK